MSLATIKSGVKLSPEQRAAVDTILAKSTSGEGGFIFITGKAGTGKSTVLVDAKDHLRCVICAPTGLAAVNVGGETIHRLFGFKTGPQNRSQVRSAPTSKAAVLANADAIVIDEISMVRADMMDAIDACLRRTLECDRPFGGKLVIALGDMWQLEPVTGEDWDVVKPKYKSQFWFDAHVFGSHSDSLFEFAHSTATITTIELTEVFRQQGDPAFVDALNAIREGNRDGLAKINERAYSEPKPGTVTLTFSNKAAEQINAVELNRLDADPLVFEADVDGDFPERDAPCPTTLNLKIGAQVMFTRNTVVSQSGDYDQYETPKTFVSNGTVGEIVGFYRGAPIVELASGETITPEKARWEKIGYEYDNELDKIIEVPQGSFAQYPLKLAWAITTHKSQGQTLDSACLSLEMPAFAHGQLYVALSRVKSFEGLHLKRALNPKDIVINPRVREFFAAAANSEQEGIRMMSTKLTDIGLRNLMEACADEAITTGRTTIYEITSLGDIDTDDLQRVYDFTSGAMYARKSDRLPGELFSAGHPLATPPCYHRMADDERREGRKWFLIGVLLSPFALAFGVLIACILGGGR